MSVQLTELTKDKTIYGVGGFFDVETTGLSPNTEEIVELCLVLFVYIRDTGQIIGHLDGYIGLSDPMKPIPKAAQRIHGITDEMVHGKKLDIDCIHELMKLAEFFVAHNASFDKGFLEKVLIFPKTKKWYCSMRGINWAAKGYDSKKLQTLLEGHGLGSQNHRADGDVLASISLISQADEDGNYYLMELLQKPLIRSRKAPVTTGSVGITLTLNTKQAAATIHDDAIATGHNVFIREDRSVYISEKSKLVMYILWFFTGNFGGHRYYLRDYSLAILMTLTFGVFGIWTLIDLFFIGKRFDYKFK